MAKSIFSRSYFASIQKKFETALNNGEYGEAKDILEGLPPPEFTPGYELESIRRMTVLNEGYRALLTELFNYLEEDYPELLRYQKIADIDELE